MQRVRRRVGAGLLAMALVEGALVASATPVLGADAFSAHLEGPGGWGEATITVDGDEVCVTFFVDANFSPYTAIGLYEGTEGDTGPLVLAFPPSGSGETYSGCASDPDAALAIVADPTYHYLLVATEDLPEGAVRGQLDAGTGPEGVSVTASAWACQGRVRSMDDVPADGTSPCVGIIRTGDFALPDGYRFAPRPVFSDLALAATDANGTHTIDEAEPDGGGTCNPSTRTCSAAMGYLWSNLAPGELSVTIGPLPRGYRLLGARVFVDGVALEATLDVASRSVTFTADAGQNAQVLVFATRGH